MEDSFRPGPPPPPVPRRAPQPGQPKPAAPQSTRPVPLAGSGGKSAAKPASQLASKSSTATTAGAPQPFDQPSPKASSYAKASDDKPADKQDKPASAASSGDDELTIRTMKDDLAATKRPSSSKPARSSAGALAQADKPRSTAPIGAPPPTPPTPQPFDKAQGEPTPKKTFPLPAKQPPVSQPAGKTGKKEKVVMAPARRRRKRRLLLPVMLLLFLILLGGGGAAAWFFLDIPLGIPGLDQMADTTTPEATTTANLEDVIPSDTALVIRYNVTSLDARSNLIDQWERGGAPASVTGLLQGDPRLLLEDANIDEFVYVLLSEDTRPYLVIPQSEAATALLANSADVNLTEESGWYVAHSLSTSLYTQALTKGSVASVGGEPLLADSTSTLQLLIGPFFTLNMRDNLLGAAAANGNLQTLSLTAEPTAGGWRFNGTATSLTLSAGQGVADQQLLSLVPASARLIALGGNFHEDLDAWREVSGVLEDALLDNAATHDEILEDLTTPYAFYTDQVTAAGRSFGLIVQLPPDLQQGQLTLGNPALEQGLTAIVPLLANRPALQALEFNESTYNEIPLRYANVSGTTRAVDYALTEQYLIMATSKDAMFAVLDVVGGNAVPAAQSDTVTDVLTAWGALPSARNILLAHSDATLVGQLLPGTGDNIFGISFSPSGTGSAVTGVVGAAEGSSSASPAPVFGTPATMPDTFGGDVSGAQQCGTYIRDGIEESVCAVCGDGICEEYEQCIPSSCDGDACTNDCGPLYCSGEC